MVILLNIARLGNSILSYHPCEFGGEVALDADHRINLRIFPDATKKLVNIRCLRARQNGRS